MTHEETQTAQVPALPPGYFSNADVRESHWKQTVATFEAAEPKSVAPSVAEPNSEALELLAQTSKHTLADGTRPLLTNSKFRATIERLRADVFAGKPFDKTAASAAVREALGMPAPAAPQVEEPAGPQGTPEERAFADASARLDTGECIDVSEFPAEMLAGYRVELPDGFGLNSEAVGMLATARAANLPQSAIDAFIKARIAEESEL